MYTASYIKFSSMTYAQMAKDALMRNGIRSVTGRNTNPKASQGCSFVLYVDSRVIEKAYAIVQTNRIKNLGYEKGAGR